MDTRDVLGGGNTKAQGDFVVTESVVESPKEKDNFKVGGDQANNTQSYSGWYILPQSHTKLSNNIDK